MRLLIVTDAWFPQVNGVVRTLSTMVERLRAAGDAVETLTPADFRSLPCPTYPEIRLAVCTPGAVARRIEAFRPTALHIATEGPLGVWARRHALKRGWPFSTSFHTRFPEYIHARTRFPIRWSYAALRRFHGAAAAVMVPTAAVQHDLERRGFPNLRLWTRGVDTSLFHPGPRPDWARDLPRPVMLSVGRVAVEKGLPDFLALDRPGTKLVVGEGPARAELERRFPEARFLGAKFGPDLADAYRAADVFVFPSRTDTFGLVMLEALASGVPVAAYPVMGPVDVIGTAPVGCLDLDLGRAVTGALAVPRDRCRAYAEQFSWAACAERFRGFLVPFA
ncbi:MAG: glycosyltransferase family 1 protein [Alphaproteobacteria bacterium]|nr:glycosyltransferase family 1 protein [Alphaproteobacteria bacterium]MCB9929669.1 glycosyltransferase family 1 protein [Alphaproteobacteria bacterium]